MVLANSIEVEKTIFYRYKTKWKVKSKSCKVIVSKKFFSYSFLKYQNSFTKTCYFINSKHEKSIKDLCVNHERIITKYVEKV